MHSSHLPNASQINLIGFILFTTVLLFVALVVVASAPIPDLKCLQSLLACVVLVTALPLVILAQKLLQLVQVRAGLRLRLKSLLLLVDQFL